jgi:hypothetical protein
MSSLFANTRLRMTFPLLVLLAFLLPFSSGCGKKDKKAQVSGQVFYHGKPMKGGTLFLHAVDKKGDKVNELKNAAPPGPPVPGMAQTNMAVGDCAITIGTDGKFTFSGAPVGKMKVTVQSAPQAMSYDQMPGIQNNPNAPENVKTKKADLPKTETEQYQIPPKYTTPEETPWTWDITPGKNPSKEFKIE